MVLTLCDHNPDLLPISNKFQLLVYYGHSLYHQGEYKKAEVCESLYSKLDITVPRLPLTFSLAPENSKGSLNIYGWLHFSWNRRLLITVTFHSIQNYILICISWVAYHHESNDPYTEEYFLIWFFFQSIFRKSLQLKKMINKSKTKTSQQVRIHTDGTKHFLSETSY